MKPFAYAVVSKECPDGMENMSLQFNEPIDAKKVIALYEHPLQIKELSDEELWELWRNSPASDKCIICFARAILRKAQEK